MTTPTRLLCLLLVLGLLVGATSVMKERFRFEIIPPKVSLSQSPHDLAGWSTEPSMPSEDELKALHADDVIGWKFVSKTGETVLTHLATWVNPTQFNQICPHTPTVCYPAAGWKITDSKLIWVEVQGLAHKVPAQVMQLQQNDQTIVIGYTYEIGDQFFFDESGARTVQKALWGDKRWPSMTKYLIQTNHAQMDAAIPRIKTMLQQFIGWHQAAYES